MSDEQRKAAKMEVPENFMAMAVTNMEKISLTPKAKRMPRRPPTRQTSTAFDEELLHDIAPAGATAMRMPISWVRSVTETSMMFMTPMPPTTREMTAMAEIIRVRVAVVFLTVFKMLSLLLV